MPRESDSTSSKPKTDIPRIRWLSLALFLVGGIVALASGWNFPDGHAFALAVLIPIVIILTTDNFGLALGTIVLWVMTSFGCGWSKIDREIPQFAFIALAGEGFLLSLVAYLWRARHTANAELRRVRQTETLTGLLNKDGFSSQIRDFSHQHRNSDMRLAVGMLDLDGFKQFNDQNGHLAGDQFLQEYAAAIREYLSGDGLAARWGGDEFAVAFLVKNLNDARERGAALLEAARPVSERHSPAVTASIGFEVIRPAFIFEIYGLEKAVAAADTALYIAKSEGGNRAHVRGHYGIE